MGAKFRKNDLRLEISDFGRFLEAKNSIFFEYFLISVTGNSELFLNPTFSLVFTLITRHQVDKG